MVKCAKINNGVIDVYFEHGASLPKVLEGNTKVASNTKGTQPPSTVSKNQNQTKKPINKVSGAKPNKPTGSIQPTKPIKTTQNTKTDKTNKSKQPNKNSISRRPCTRSGARGFQSKVFNNEIPFEVSSDSYESAEDSLFKPTLDEDSSSNSDTGVKNVNNGSRNRVNKNHNEKILTNVGPLAKGKEKILVEDDAFVQEVSDEEVDLGFIGSFAEGVEYSLDPGADSDGANSWHSEEMKTPLNSEDELEEDNDSDDACPVFREGARFGELHLEVGMKFGTKWDFREAVREYTIQEGRRIRLAKNDNIRCRAVCKVKECPWVVYASRDHEDTCWQIKTFNDDHTCPREDKNRAANRNWVCSKLVKKVRKYPNFRHCEATTYFRTRFDLTLNKNSISRALMDARSVVYGDEKEQYKMVRDYGLTLLKTNPGSTVQICTKPQPNGEVIFERMYVCLSGCKNGFKSGCRPLIGLDGAFLKTQFGGQILSAVGQDANHHIYVIAWTIVEIENRENWKWFLELLHLDLGHYKKNGWCFISDMQKGLISAVQEVMPNVHHRFCVWYLWRNFNKSWKDLQLRGLLWECARATTHQEFRDGMDKIKRLNEDAWTYLDKWQRDAWTRSAFSHKPL
ncbi:hypothetical protein Ahy_B05g078897 [Arachis hypogaea]|uniref:Transposase MuDR plant domain-containing protein n=2 Tax=Arachis hypogaea TaxID=3818 RepID=A0A444Z8L2_ARAHY|nr:hypothetical protein Ahy_B05g078897 [Arachis hypogaea]